MNQEPKILSIDTSSRDGSIAILNGQEVLAEVDFYYQDKLSIIFIDILDSLLKKTGLKINQIDLFVVINGPGLFTGIRVGLTSVKGFTFLKGLPIAGVTSLEALAYEFKDLSRELIALIDARRDEVYLAGYKAKKGELIEFISPCLLHYSKIPEVLINLDTVKFMGSGALKYKEFLNKQMPECEIYESSKGRSVLAAQVGLKKFQKGDFIKDHQKLLPLYIRKTDAEINHNKGK